MSSDTPQFTHDCTNCTFLGRYEHEGKPHDLYYCGQAVHWPTVVARSGDDGPDYCSGMIFAEQGIQPYAEALRRAVERGLEPPL
jgi:hypothetical protein